MSECEIEQAVYQNHGFGLICPQLHCACGFIAEAETWEETGYLYDEHLKYEEH